MWSARECICEERDSFVLEDIFLRGQQAENKTSLYVEY